MFYEVEIEDVVRVPPDLLKSSKEETVYNILRLSYIGMTRKDLGIIVTIKDIKEISEGMVIPEDGGVYYRVKFTAYTFKPEINELVYGVVANITDFGVFATIGPIDGLIHISQIMDDEVIISGKEALMGKRTRKVLKVNDLVRARVISISYKDITNIKTALTMRQVGLGKIEWIEEDKKGK
jgi:DNA-directed RNA polymerase subunit E'